MNRHARYAPIGASSATGGRTVEPMNDTNEPGTCWIPRTRPRSSASALVAWIECSGLPVTIRSVSAQMAGGDERRSARLAPERRFHNHQQTR